MLNDQMGNIQPQPDYFDVTRNNYINLIRD